MDEVYNPYEFAKSQGFSDADANQLAKAGADATNIRHVAIAKWGEAEAASKRGDKPKPQPKPKPEQEPDIGFSVVEPESTVPVVTEPALKLELPLKHKHHYRKDGTCACGAVRKAKG